MPFGLFQKNIPHKLPLLVTILYLTMVFFLPTQLGKHFWPSFSYIQGLRSDYLSPTLYVTDLLLLFLFFVTLTTKPKVYVPIRQWVSRYPFIAASVLAVFFGVFFSKEPVLGALGVLRVCEVIFLAIFTNYFLRTRRRGHAWLCVTVALSIIFEFALTITQFSLQHSVGGIFYLFGERDFSSVTPGIANASLHGSIVLRPYGTFSHPNILAGFFVIASLLCIALMKAQKSSVFRLIICVACIMGSVGALLTLSRVGGLLMLLLCAVMLFGQRNYLLKKNIITISLGALSLGAIVFALLLPRFLAPDFFGQSLQERMQFARESLHVISTKPFLGVGLNEYLLAAAKESNALSFKHEPVHNVFLLLTAESGVIGISGVVWIYYSAWKVVSTKKNVFLLLLFFTVLVFSLSDHFFATSQQGRLLVGLVAGVLLSLKKV